MAFQLPELPYAYDALSPILTSEVMVLHHDKHHLAYVNKLNETLADWPEFLDKQIGDLLINLSTLPQEIAKGVRNFGGGHYNHTFFWEGMKLNNGEPPRGQLAEGLVRDFGSFEGFKKEFDRTASALFGSGWTWLVYQPQTGQLQIRPTANQDCPLSDGLTPILVVDEWEHAYYLQYQNRRPDYLSSWWQAVHWDRAEELYLQASGK